MTGAPWWRTGYFAPAKAEVAAEDRVAALERALLGGAAHVLVIDGLQVSQGSGEEETSYGRIEDGALRSRSAGSRAGDDR